MYGPTSPLPFLGTRSRVLPTVILPRCFFPHPLSKPGTLFSCHSLLTTPSSVLNPSYKGAYDDPRLPFLPLDSLPSLELLGFPNL